MKEWKFVGLCLLLGCLIFFSLNQFAKALQPKMNSLDGDLGGWEIEAISAIFDKVESISKDDAWALQYDSELPDSIYRYDGNQWQLEQIFNADEDVIDLDMVSATDGWALGRVYAGLGTGGTGVLWRYDGRSWNRFAMPVDQHIYALDMHSSTEGWALGDETLLRFDGTRWQEIGSGLKLSSQNNAYYDLKVFSETEAWIHYGWAVYFYDGTQWEAVSEIPNDILYFAMISPTDGWAYSGGFYNEGVFHYDGNEWSSVSDPPTLGQLSAISSDNIWSIKSGNELRHYDGEAWSLVALPDDAPQPKSISMADAESGWILGRDGRMIKYVDGAWVVQELDTIPVHFTSSDLDQVKISSNGIVWTNVQTHFKNGRWEPQTLHPELMGFVKEITQEDVTTLTSISLDFDVSPPNEGWATGSVKYKYLFGPPGYPSEIGHSVSNILFKLDGVMWRPITTIPIYYSSFDMLSEESGWAVSSSTWYGVLQQYDGNSWEKYPLTDIQLYDLQMLATDHGWAVGSSTRMLSTVGVPYQYSAVLQFDGTEWRTTEDTPGYGLYAIDMISETEGWAVGAEGTILHYVDGDWLLEPSPVEINLYDVDMVSPNEGWAIGRDSYRLGVDFLVCKSTILRYDGTSWQVAGNLDGFCLRSMSVLDSNTGRIVGDNGLILKLAEQVEPTPTPEPTSTVTSTLNPSPTSTTYTPIPTLTSTPTVMPTATSTTVPSSTATLAPTAALQPTATSTAVPTTTPMSLTSTPTSAPSSTDVPVTPTIQPTSTINSTPTPTSLPPTFTSTPTVTIAATTMPLILTATLIPVPTSTPIATETPNVIGKSQEYRIYFPMIAQQ